jgi:hypothetical protein
MTFDFNSMTKEWMRFITAYILGCPDNSFIQKTQNKRMEITSTPDAFDSRINSTRRKHLASERTPSF